MKQHVFIIGSKGIPAQYGGFESFLEKLTEYRKSEDICYHISRRVVDIETELDEKKSFMYHGARCFNVKALPIGPAKAISYDIQSLQHCLAYIKTKKISHPIVYILACRIGPVMAGFKHQIEKLGGTLYVNPDGHEWKRGKWSAPVRRYWKISERLMVKEADLLICDSKSIEKYIQSDYEKYHPKTTFIAYGAETCPSKLADNSDEFTQWCEKNQIRAGEYYLVVGRFVPENNYETMITEFIKSDTKKDFVLVTGVDNEKFMEQLQEKTAFRSDKRIKFVGTVYNQELLKKIREQAFGYFHGHEVGGTNPSLLEALGTTRLNLLLDVGFNREVGEDGALYWTKEPGNLANLIHQADNMAIEDMNRLEKLAKERIEKWYSWEYIVAEYENVFLRGKEK
ncbi:MAG: DUF1972 domain-containing protein [Hespellia sp.]|nr:DUF1972 domain-containing protein [Hespellia sp.]